MRPGAWIAAALAALLCAGSAGPLAGAPPLSRQEPQLRAPSSPDFARALESLIPRLMSDGDVPGLALAAVEHGRVVWHRAFGVKDAATGAAVDDSTIFEAASLSKPVFAYAVEKLVDRGVLDLDTPLSKYLPGDYVEDPRARSITPRHVLSHTTGFPNWRAAGRPLETHFAPGERFSYSGEGFVYLQKAVERVTGETLNVVMKRLVFDPLGMTSSSYSWETRFEGRKATGHDAAGNPRPMRRPAEAVSAATLHTTALDYARFLAAALDAGTRRAPASGAAAGGKVWSEIFRPQVHVDEGCQNCVDKKPSGRISRELAWGLGWGIEETEEGLAVRHWGDNSSGFHSFVIGYPRSRVGLVVLTNGLDGHGIIPEIVAAGFGGRHPSFAWLDYERYDSSAHLWFKEILARGVEAVGQRRPSKSDRAAAALTEQQVNRVGYWLLGRKRVKEAIAVFERNAADFPDSWNVWDSLGEAYAEDGQRERAIASYEKSLALSPSNAAGAERLRKLKSGGA